VVIGGGIAGLTAVKVCQDHGIDAHAFERTEHVGGVWNHTYKNVRLQQHKDDFRLSGTEWHPGVKDFPDAKAVEAYIGKFVRRAQPARESLRRGRGRRRDARREDHRLSRVSRDERAPTRLERYRKDFNKRNKGVED